MTRAALLLLGLVGCDQAFGLERPPPTCADLTDHDEDGDGVVDTCDNCPGIANPDQNNDREMMAGAPLDDVGDACDPEPSKGGDRLATLLTFEDASAMVDWDVVSGGWRITGDAMTGDGTMNPDFEVALYELSHPPLGRYVVHARIAFDAIGVENHDYYVGIIPTYVVGLDRGPAIGSTECSILRNAGPTDFVDAFINGSEEKKVPLQMSKLAAGAAYFMRARPSATGIACQVDGDLGDGGSASAAGPVLDGQLAIELRHTAVRIEYIAIYEAGS